MEQSEIAELLRKLAFSFRYPFGKPNLGLNIPAPKVMGAKLAPPKMPSLTASAEPGKVVPNPGKLKTERMQEGLGRPV